MTVHQNSISHKNKLHKVAFADWQSVLCDAPLPFLRLLRAMNALASGNPDRRERCLQEIAELDQACDGLRLVRELNLASGVLPSALKLTAFGKQLCDGVKQYVNWLDHSMELPRGVTEQMIQGKDVLDVGCGVGCALLTFSRRGATQSLTGVDLIESFLQLARLFASRESIEPPRLFRCNGSHLPFPDQSFDFIFCRLALNYMRSDAALSEMSRVAKNGAHLVVIVNTLPWEIATFMNNVRSLRFKSIAFGLIKFFNGVLFHTTRRQITIRYPGKMMSVHTPIFHTTRTIRRDLARWDFQWLSDDSTEHRQTPAFVSRRVTRSGFAEPCGLEPL